MGRNSLGVPSHSQTQTARQLWLGDHKQAQCATGGTQGVLHQGGEPHRRDRNILHFYALQTLSSSNRRSALDQGRPCRSQLHPQPSFAQGSNLCRQPLLSRKKNLQPTTYSANQVLAQPMGSHLGYNK